ncbi:MAG TPA: glucosaminidase domain-containing protein [Gammaproteobacteria bacterium]|nr:glucosaminidase domain-containing protein [Gammaproteobacteria bacterium]
MRSTRKKVPRGRGVQKQAPTTLALAGRAAGYTLLALLPLSVAGLVSWQYQHTRLAAVAASKIELIPINPPSAQALQNIFSSEDYAWPPQSTVPPYAIQNLPYGLDTLDKDQKKTVFFRALLPIVLAENLRIWNQRVFLLQQFGQGTVDPATDSGQEVARIAGLYRVEGDLNDPNVRETLLRRVDVVPVSLVLAQAAQESGWGTSRFALESNNLFGIWTWNEDAGSVPMNRADDATHMVRVYPDIQSSVRAYLHNIDIGFAYTDFRDLRAQMRAAGKPLDPFQLAGELDRYSTAGDLYVANIRAMLRSSELDKLSKLPVSSAQE